MMITHSDVKYLNEKYMKKKQTNKFSCIFANYKSQYGFYVMLKIHAYYSDVYNFLNETRNCRCSQGIARGVQYPFPLILLF